MNRVLTAVFLTVLMCGFSIAQQAVPKDTRITLERTDCLVGECIWYTLSITADGSTEFESHSWTSDNKLLSTPPFRSSIDPDKVNQLIMEFEKISYFSLRGKYGNAKKSDRHCPNRWTDQPWAITSITIKGKTKEIRHYLGCKGSLVLDKLTALEKKIDEIANTEQWLKQLRKEGTD